MKYDDVVGAETGRGQATWRPRDVALYQLGLGAGSDPTSAGELRYVLEDRLVVLPSFATVLGSAGIRDLRSAPGLDYNPRMSVHAEHEVEILRPLESAGTVETEGRVRAIYDKGSGALLEIEAVSRSQRGEPQFVNRYSLFLRGAGGFGGARGPGGAAVAAPAGEPDAVVRVPTLPQQALLYRLSGDRNKIHSDPGIARAAGFRQPILHGLCTFGIVCKAVVDAVYDGDVSRVSRFRGRFAREVYPGDVVTVRAWSRPDGVVVVASVDERGVDVLTRGRAG